MKKVIALTLALVLALSCFVGCGKEEPAAPAAPADPATPAAPADPAAPAESEGVDMSDWVELNFVFSSYVAENNNACYPIMNYMMERLKDEMPGLVNVTAYYNGSLVAQADSYDGVVDGICNLAMVEPTLMYTRLPVTQLFSYPGVFCSSGSSSTAAMNEMLKGLEEYSDVHYLFGFRGGPQNIITTKQPNSASDLSGLQIRGNTVIGETINALGGVAVSVAFTDVYESIRSGMIDGMMSSEGIMMTQHLEEVTDYCYIYPILGSPSIYVMSKELYESMPESQREVFDAVVDETFQNCILPIEDECLKVQNSINYLTNLEINWVEGEELEQVVAKTEPLILAYVEELNNMGYDGDALFAQFKELAAKYNEIYTYEDYQALVNSIANGEVEATEYYDYVIAQLEAARANAN